MTRLPFTLRKVGEYLLGSRFDAAAVIIVNDGSDDGISESALQEETVHRAGATLRVIQNPVNMGKGFSVRCGMTEAIYENVLFMDADACTPVEELDHLLCVLSEGKHDVVIGSRALNRSLIGVRQPFWRASLAGCTVCTHVWSRG